MYTIVILEGGLSPNPAMWVSQLRASRGKVFLVSLKPKQYKNHIQVDPTVQEDDFTSEKCRPRESVKHLADNYVFIYWLCNYSIQVSLLSRVH